MNEFDNFDEYEEFLGNYEHTPDDDVWDKILVGVPKVEPVGKAVASGKVVGGMFWKMAAVGFLAFLVGSGFLYFNESRIAKNENKESLNISESQLPTAVDDLSSSVMADISLNKNKKENFKEVNEDAVYGKASIYSKNNFTKNLSGISQADSVEPIYPEEKIIKNANGEIADILLEKNNDGEIADILLEKNNDGEIADILLEKNTNGEIADILLEKNTNGEIADILLEKNNDGEIADILLEKNNDGEIADILLEKNNESNPFIQDKENESVNLLDGKQDFLESILQDHKIAAKKHLPEQMQKNFGGLNVTVYGEYGLQDWHDTDHNSERLFWDSKLHTHSNFGAGVLIGKNISKNISLQTGLEFSEINHSFKTYGRLIATEEEDVFCLKLDTYLHQYDLKATGEKLVTVPVSDLYMNTNHRFRFLSIPIWARYSFNIGSKLDLGFSTGLAAVFLTQNRLQLIDFSTREVRLSNFEMEDNSGINDLSFSIALATDLEYSIGRRTKLMVQASYKESIRANNASSNIKLKGLNFRGGLKLLLK